MKHCAVTFFAAAVALISAPLLATAQHTTAEPRLLDTVVVSGHVTGPGFWQVYKDDDHEMWIMGAMSPHPANIEWDATEAKRLVTDADLILWPPSYGLNIKSNLFQQLGLGYGYLKAQKNPDGKSLQDVLTPELYSRWRLAKQRHMPNNRGVERQRPITAAQELLESAVKRAHLSTEPLIYPALKDTIKGAGIAQLQPKVTVHLTAAQAKTALAEIRSQDLDDVSCLEATLDAIEQDVPRMIANANAWATGDVTSIRFEAMAKRETLCSESMMRPEFSAKHGIPNIPASLRAEMLKSFENALATKRLTFAVVDMQDLVGPNNILQALRARGYTVNGP